MKNKVPLSIINRLNKSFQTLDNMMYVAAPGRINLIGEHTDYNNGLVLPAAIDKKLFFAIQPNNTDSVNITAIDKDEKQTVHLKDLKKSSYLWADYLTGILIEFQKLGVDLKGFDCSFTSEVPIGAGMSSSAALECAFLYGVKEFHNLDLDLWTMIKMSKSSNHNFLGIKGGILDQFASLFGQNEKIMLLDCDSLEYKYINYQKSKYTWLLINSCVSHNHKESGYNDRVRECHEALQEIQKVYPDAKHLSSIHSVDQLAQVSFSSPILNNRAKYIVEENARVKDFIHELGNEDYNKCGELLYASHHGLSKEYEVSCDELDFLVACLENHKAVLGSRMMGGGFGGCTINLIEASAMEEIKAHAKKAFTEKDFTPFKLLAIKTNPLLKILASPILSISDCTCL